MHKGPTGPQSGQTPRTIAEQKGTAAGGFEEGPKYDVCGGHPITKDMPAGEYKDRAQTTPSQTRPLDIAAPFSIKGGE